MVNQENTNTDDLGQKTDSEESSQEDRQSHLPPAEVPPQPNTISVESNGEEQKAPALPYLLVAIGASAGGLQAVRELLENLPGDTGMSFVLVTHLAPDQKSLLSEILERYTSMPVLPIESGVMPEQDSFYILLPNELVRMQDGHFVVEERASSSHSPATIDNFFLSVADDLKGHAVGVVLSGADSDGARGLKAIKDEGGITLVQKPESALHSDMPRSSIAADHVDFIAAPAEISAELARLAQQFMHPHMKPLEEGNTSEDGDRSFQLILQELHRVSGLEFEKFRPETIRRRMARRMMLLRLDSLEEYSSFLLNRPDEVRTLQEDLLINVTRFFRDPGFWISVQSNVLPVLLQRRSQERLVRIWCAGCSTGEEVYSLAILISEFIAQNHLAIGVQIFGTDASERSIEQARAAIYPDSIANEVSPDRIRRYFVKVDNGYQVSKNIRELCIFARQNLCNDPPFSHIDILSCRNVMIYFNQALQRQVMSTFSYALEDGGYMLLGISEGLRDYGEFFLAVDARYKIYLKTGRNPVLDASRDYRISLSRPAASPLPVEPDKSPWTELELKKAADRIVLTRFSPPGLIVDDRWNVLQSRGQTTSFIEVAPGAVDWKLFRVLRENIATEVKAALLRSIDENMPVSTSYIAIEETGDEQHLQIDVLPISSSSRKPRCFLILFRTVEENQRRRILDQPSPPVPSGEEKERLLPLLRQELEATRFNLQSLIEERDARNQELLSANEEIQSANEELQSTNEELETTKEELQSANEELQTVNDELQQRNIILTRTGNDLSNLLTSVNIPLLMLTSDLSIRQFTPPLQKLLNIRALDVGRSINEIRLQLSLENIEPILRDVLETLASREVEVQDREGRWLLLRVRPYRTADNKIEGLVVVFVDIDQLRNSQQAALEASSFASSVLESVPVPLVVLDKDCTIRTANLAFRLLTQMRLKELFGRSYPDLVLLLWGLLEVRGKIDLLLAGEEGQSFEFEYISTTADVRILLIRGKALSNDGSRVVLLAMEDITIRRQAESLITLHTESLESEVTAAGVRLNQTQEELRGLTGHLFTVQEEERQKVARELHDDVSQRLSLLELLLKEISQSTQPQLDSAKMAEAQQMLQLLNMDVRNISHQLHPAILDDLGLPAALKALVDEFGAREGMPASYRSKTLPDMKAQPAATAIYRITQEALRNVAKHAGKTHVKVLLQGLGNRLRLEVRDLGVGFDQETETDKPLQGLGMITMKERARLAHGTLTVTSALGEGTIVTAEIPLETRA